MTHLSSAWGEVTESDGSAAPHQPGYWTVFLVAEGLTRLGRQRCIVVCGSRKRAETEVCTNGYMITTRQLSGRCAPPSATDSFL